MRPPHQLTLRRQTDALGLRRDRAARPPARHRRAATPSNGRPAPPPRSRCHRSAAAREVATPETPAATAAAPKTDAPRHESHAAPNSAGSDPTNRSRSASSTSANWQSTVVVEAAATPRVDRSTAHRDRSRGGAGGQHRFGRGGCSETEAVPLETRAVPKALSAPSAPPDVVPGVVSNALASVGLSPSVSDNQAPVDSPAELAVLAWARRENQQTQPLRATVRGGGEFRRTGPRAAQPADEPAACRPRADDAGDRRDRQSCGTTAAVTFFGQFIDHDLTLDNEPQPTETIDVEGLVNGRSFALDLDSVYGGGPTQSPQLYDGDKFLIGTATDGVSPDLPRNGRMAPQSWWSTATTRTSSSPRCTCRS